MTRLNQRSSLAGLLALFLVAFAGCDGGTEPEDPKLTGEWTGQVTLGLFSATITLGLTESDTGDVTGTMTWTVAGQPSGNSDVSGTHNYPDVTLNLKVALGPQELTGKYVAKLTTEDRMEGTFSTDDGSITGPAVLTRKAE